MKKYAWQSIKQGHFISGANLDDKQHLSMPNSESISNVHPYRGCVIGNVILFAICVVLTLIGGLIPSKQAAKKDPVLALRSE